MKLDLEIEAEQQHPNTVSRIEEIESQLAALSQSELREVRDWLDDLIEDGLEFTPEFEAAVRQSEAELAQGVRPRVRKP